MSVLARVCALILCVALVTLPGNAQAPAETPALFNTVKQKLKAGGQVVGATITLPSPEVYCTLAASGFDFTWIEMQHSPLTYQDVARMIATCKGPAVPMIRVPDASEGDIQKATDIGALGIIVPMVDTVAKAENAVRFTKYPPLGRRSQGSGQYGALWGANYRRTANDNIMVIAMIENPAGVAIVDKIAAVAGIDGIFVAATDLGSFSGMRQNEPGYEALVTKVFDATRKAGLFVGGPSAWKETRKGYQFFQGPEEAQFLRLGAKVSLGGQPVEPGQQRGVAPIEGQR